MDKLNIETIPVAEVPPIIKRGGAWVLDIIEKLKALPPDQALRITTQSTKDAYALQIRLQYYKNRRGRTAPGWNIPLKKYAFIRRGNTVFIALLEETTNEGTV